MFAEGLYRLAQLAHDSKAPGVPVLFTWASRGKPTAYVYDLNSATAARDGLEHTLRLLLASNAEQVNVLAHSMGNWVTVEAFRQIKISGDLGHANKIGYVVSRGARYRHRRVQVAIAPLRQAAQAVLCRALQGRSSAVSLENHRRRRHARRRTAPMSRSSRRWGRPSSISPTSKPTDATNHDKFAQLAAVAPELRDVLAHGIPANSRASDAGDSSRERRRRDRRVADHAARRADEDHRQSIVAASQISSATRCWRPRAFAFALAPIKQPPDLEL